MRRHCPVCGHPLDAHEIVCPGCRQRIESREPARREGVLYAWGRGLMLFLAVLFFLKGAFATASPGEYESLVRSFGIQSVSSAAQYISAAFTLTAALLYAVAWAGSYIGRAWDARVCLAALLVFVVGQAVARTVAAAADGGWPQAVALFVLWVAVPVFQYCAFWFGSPEAEPAPAAPEAGEEPA